MKPLDDYDKRVLERGRLRYEQGDKRELLYWLGWCVINNRQIPSWIRQALQEALHAASSYRIRSWDEVFGPPVPKGTKLKVARRKHEIAWPLFERVRDLVKAGRPIDDTLFEEVGREFGIGKTVASELYYEVGRELLEQLAEQESAQGTSGQN